MLRVCLGRCYSSQAANHHLGDGHLDDGGTGFRRQFVILAQAPEAIEPPEGPLPNPALGNDHEPCDGGGTLGHLPADRPVPPEFPDPVYKRAGIGPISPDMPQPCKLVPQTARTRFAPSRSCPRAAVTVTDRIKPRVSTRIGRVRPVMC